MTKYGVGRRRAYKIVPVKTVGPVSGIGRWSLDRWSDRRTSLRWPRRCSVSPRQGAQCSFGDDDDGVGAGLGAQRPSRFKIFCGPRNHKPLRAPPITDEIAAMSAALTPPPARHASRPPSACLRPRLPELSICARVCARSSCQAVGSDAARPLDFGNPSSRLISSRRHRRRRQISVVEQSCSSVDWRRIVSLHLIWRQPCPPASSA